MSGLYDYKLLCENGNRVKITLTDPDEVVITDATVTVTVVDSDLVEVVGETWPLSMPHVSAGLYQANLVSTLELTANDGYYIIVDAVAGDGTVAKWKQFVTAVDRDNQTQLKSC